MSISKKTRSERTVDVSPARNGMYAVQSNSSVEQRHARSYRGSSLGTSVTDPMKDRIVRGVRLHAKEGRTWADVYRKTLNTEFKESLPTYGQFVYWAKKLALREQADR